MPEETIGIDEILLLKAESGCIGETLRFWIPKEYYVVVGRAGKVEEECFVDRCEQDGVKVIRRISGGGTVLQGPGCLNYSVILSFEEREGMRDIRSSYAAILGMIIDELEKEGYNASAVPLSDIALDDKKISGNAQARKKKFFLHHGTFLFGLDLDRIPVYLKHPPNEPVYRKGRSHRDFLTNLPIGQSKLEELIKRAFLPSENVWRPDESDLKALDNKVLEKFATKKWNNAF